MLDVVVVTAVALVFVSACKQSTPPPVPATRAATAETPMVPVGTVKDVMKGMRQTC